MGVETQHHHRPTLKQTNKPFKSKHATKSAQKNRAKGRMHRQAPKLHNQQNAAAQLRVNRKNAAKQAQIRKRQAFVSATRLFSGVNGAPRIVAVVPLTEDAGSQKAAMALAESLQVDAEDCPTCGLWRLKADRFKTSLQFINLQYRQFYAALDACKAADYVLFVLSPTVEVDQWGELLMRTLQAQGLPTIIASAISMESLDAKSRSGVLKSLLSFMQYFVPSLSRVFDLSVSSDRTNALRALCEGRPADVRWRENRSWLLSEDLRWNPESESESESESDLNPDASAVAQEEPKGRLLVTGVLRGAPFSANRLIHIPNFGDFQVEKIVSALPPQWSHRDGMEVEPQVLSEPILDGADSLVSTNEPDVLEDEKTWPTEEEMQAGTKNDGSSAQSQIADAGKGTTPRRLIRVPKGWSDYQAAWIVENDDEEEYGDEEEVAEDGNDAGVGQETEMDRDGGEEGEDDGMEERYQDEIEMASDRKSVQFQDLDMEEETRQLEEWRSRDRNKEEAEDAAFPDEIDTPRDIPARTRFQRYRGLRSFRTSPWDPYESLPPDYARIFQFEDFKRTERNVKARMEAEGYGVQPGTRVTITIKDFPLSASLLDPTRPFVIFGLLQHEHKVSVLNFTAQRNTEYHEPVRSKDPLLLCYGPRRVLTNPIYSQHTRGGGKGANNVHKFERWLRHGVTVVATTYGPVVFGNQPCMLLRETDDPQAPQLVATGSFLDADTTRIIAKRIILTGHPFRVHKKTATVRYLFFNPEDVRYFAPVQLHTKYGRTGHIRDSLGTHGYFKAHFDGPVTQMDSICMSLYKRVYPRWPTAWKEIDCATRADDAMEE